MLPLKSKSPCKLLESEKQIAITKRWLSVQDIYDKYAGMLLGFMVQALKDQQLAEQCLIDFFASLPQHLDIINNGNTGAWVCLLHLAKKQLAVLGLSNTNKVIGTNPQNDLLNLMTTGQRTVFVSIYYHGKTVAQLADELKTTEDTVRKILKEVFIIIRKGS